ncbi:hypothetical protein F183_A02590 [Bryobacterales bacterium F-183]|nr:hypothetical protein F183_A02590 [Bryobacterales bacterium F-183]
MHPLAQAALIDPTICFKHTHDRHNESGYKEYVCHAAAVHWALVALGKTGPQAEELIAALIRGVEQKAGKKPGEVTDPWQCYAPLFTTRTLFVHLPNNQLAAQCGVGDVIIVGPPTRPEHSMIVVANTNGTVWIRGFNNFLTFGNTAAITPPQNAYDSLDRDLSTRASPHLNPIYRVHANMFMATVRHTFGQEVGATF